MKNLLAKPKFRFNWKIKLLVIMFVVLFIIAGINEVWKAIDRFYDTYYFQRNKVIEVILRKPIEIKKREIEIKEIVKVISEIPNPVDLKTDTEKYIYEVFGIEDYKVAIAIAKSESGLREDAIGINSNSIDVGIFQINSTHFKKEGCSLKDVSTMKGNVDCAYKIFKVSGWTPWTVWNTGVFKNKYK